ncbi:hypothetical protein [Deinococcus wulumuqiensis]|nr:hypothetical protein [Deinococcus wulumuqiensis]
MILAADVQYGEDGAHAAAVLFCDWANAAPQRTLLKQVDRLARGLEH